MPERLASGTSAAQHRGDMLRGVVQPPRPAINVQPCVRGHLGVSRSDVKSVVAIQILLERNALLEQFLVVL